MPVSLHQTLKMADKVNTFIIKNRFHFIAWLSFMLYEILITGLLAGGFGSFVDYMISYSVNISLFYFHAHIALRLITKFRNVEGSLKGFLFIVIVAIEIIAYLPVMYAAGQLIQYLNGNVQMPIYILNRDFFLTRVWRALYFIGFSTGYYYLITYLKEKEKTTRLERERFESLLRHQQMEKELARAENAYLRAQINPHFLFNTLNFIYNNTRKIAPLASEAVMALSEMMRYAVDNSTERGLIKISDELEQVHNLLRLHQLRQKQELFFSINADDGVEDVSLLPLILITLAENMFKHGNLSLSNHPASLSVYFENDDLCIETENLKNDIHNYSGLGSGLENIHKRLTFAYGDHVQFSYDSTPRNHFVTNLRVKRSALLNVALPAMPST